METNSLYAYGKARMDILSFLYYIQTHKINVGAHSEIMRLFMSISISSWKKDSGYTWTCGDELISVNTEEIDNKVVLHGIWERVSQFCQDKNAVMDFPQLNIKIYAKPIPEKQNTSGKWIKEDITSTSIKFPTMQAMLDCYQYAAKALFKDKECE